MPPYLFRYELHRIISEKADNDSRITAFPLSLGICRTLHVKNSPYQIGN
jgi:hypothetical protein